MHGGSKDALINCGNIAQTGVRAASCSSWCTGILRSFALPSCSAGAAPCGAEERLKPFEQLKLLQPRHQSCS